LQRRSCGRMMPADQTAISDPPPNRSSGTKPEFIRGILQGETTAYPKNCVIRDVATGGGKVASGSTRCTILRTASMKVADEIDGKHSARVNSLRSLFLPSPAAGAEATSVDSVSVSYTWCGPALPSLIHIHFFHRPRNTALRFSTKASRPSRPSLVSNNPVWLARSRSSASSR
jgi:hypothetical protein